MTSVGSLVLLDSLSALNDSARLRILRVLVQHELSVGEVAVVIQLPQSTASRHLKLLFEAGFVSRRTVGTVGLYRIATEMSTEIKSLWSIASNNTEQLHGAVEDAERLVAVLTQRHADSRTFFQNIGSDWEALRKDLFGSAFTSAALLSLIDPNLRVVDIGCGIGNAATMIAPFVQEVIGVDREVAMITQATCRPDLGGNISFVFGEANELPLENDSVDVALFCLVLHHIESIEHAIQEACRVVQRGGKLCIVDMQQHTRDENKNTMGHVHLGFSEEAMHTIASNAGCTLKAYHRMQPRIDAKGPSLFTAILEVAH
ncbi:MAG: metalloregulator ArsR/SmtB family transcription factor [Phycisphaerae bacterium]|nr:metalloregulator ArsR/SmtB family transcription factor [Phycisphaerae bacterium]